MQTEFSQTVIVFGCASCEGVAMPPHFFRKSLRLNSDAYVELMITIVKSWITMVANGRPCIWQQDSAPATPLGKVKNCCRRIFASPSIPMFGLRTRQISTPWIIMFAVEKDANCRASTTLAQIRQILRPFPWKV